MAGSIARGSHQGIRPLGEGSVLVGQPPIPSTGGL